MALAFNKLNAFVADLANKQHNLGADQLKIMLTNTPPAATNAVVTDITEIGAGNGYTAGGSSVTVTASTQTGGLYKLTASNPPTWTAAGGPISTFRYLVLYNSANNKLIGYYDYGTPVALQVGEQFQPVFDAVNGVLTIQ